MKTIWKYSLNDSRTITMPKDAQILSVQTQNGECCMWALVETEAELETRTFSIYGTGMPIGDHAKRYIGTYQLLLGALVLHLFEIIQEAP